MLVINRVDDIATGISFLFIFGLGSIVGMFVCGMLFSVPFRMAEKSAFFQKILLVSVGVLSIGFGVSILFEVLLA